MRWSGAALILGALAAGCASEPAAGTGTARSTGSTTSQRTGPAEWYEAVEPFHVVGPVHYVGTRELAAYLVVTPEGSILIDGGMPGSSHMILASMKRLGFDPADLRFLLTTQAHVDHVGTTATLKRVSGAQVAATEADGELLRTGGAADYLFAGDASYRFEAVEPDRILRDGDAVTLGGVTLTAHATPGHTRGSTTFTTTVQDGGRNWHVVFPASTTVNPGTRLADGPSYPGITDDYRRTFVGLATLQADIVLPSHAGTVKLLDRQARAGAEGVAAYADASEWRAGLAAQRASFEATVADQGGAADLSGTVWRLFAVRNADGSALPPDDPDKYTFAFGPDGRLAVRVDCNRGSAEWKVPEPGRIELGPMALTKALCLDQSLHDVVVHVLNQLRTYRFEGQRLLLAGEPGDLSLELEVTTGEASQAGAPR